MRGLKARNLLGFRSMGASKYHRRQKGHLLNLYSRRIILGELSNIILGGPS